MSSIEVYESPPGFWVAHAVGILSDGFRSRENALAWALEKASAELDRLWAVEDTLSDLVVEAEELIGNLIDCEPAHHDDPCPDDSLYCAFTSRAVAAQLDRQMRPRRAAAPEAAER